MWTAQRRVEPVQVTGEELRDGGGQFEIAAHVPVSASFGLADDLRSKASGDVAFYGYFSHWQLLEENPFYEVSTWRMSWKETWGG